jgi:hypothetical protein
MVWIFIFGCWYHENFRHPGSAILQAGTSMKDTAYSSASSRKGPRLVNFTPLKTEHPQSN